jgi:5'-3' exoribonuclease 2
MLGLSTHEPQFYILRESIMQDKDKKCRRCHKMGHLSHECGNDDNKDPHKVRQAQAIQFQFVKIAIVREYLYLEFKDVKLPKGFAFDFERIVDDFVFLCFFVGNDFLPHLPSLVIREGALDAIIFIYKNLLPSLGGYLTNGKGGLNFSEVDVLLDDLARVEEEFFRQHQRNAERNEERRRRDAERDIYQA